MNSIANRNRRQHAFPDPARQKNSLFGTLSYSIQRIELRSPEPACAYPIFREKAGAAPELDYMLSLWNKRGRLLFRGACESFTNRKFVNSSRTILFSGYQHGRWEIRMMRSIREMLGFQADGRSGAVGMTSFANLISFPR